MDTITLNGLTMDWDEAEAHADHIPVTEAEAEKYEEAGEIIFRGGGGSPTLIRLKPPADGTIVLQPKSSMQGRAASRCGHANYGYAGYFKCCVYLDGKRKTITDVWRLFPNKEHHFARQGDKKEVEGRIAKIFEEMKGKELVKVKGGYAISVP